jgi:hypothetical protein
MTCHLHKKTHYVKVMGMSINKRYINIVACTIVFYLYLKLGLHDFMIGFSLITEIIDAILVIIYVLVVLILWQLTLYDFLKNKGKK